MSPLNKANDTLLDDPHYYINRELSWLAFNRRVMEEAMDQTNPLLERLKFLAIVSSNLDEFFMVRVAGLKEQVKANYTKPDPKSGLTPNQQLQKIARLTHELIRQQYELYHELQTPLNKEKIAISSIDTLSAEAVQNLEIYFDEYIYPVLTPMAIDTYRPFPMLLNKSINIAVLLGEKLNLDDKATKVAIVQVPALLGRYIQLDENDHRYVLLEDIISHFIPKLFKGYHVQAVTEFRITRNADLSIHEEGASDLLYELEQELKKRKWGQAVRLEVRKQKHSKEITRFLHQALHINKHDLYVIDGPLDLSFLFSFHKNLAPDKEELVYQAFIPQAPQDIAKHESVFDAAVQRDLFIHHPYESFEPVQDLVNEAAIDPDVLAIKQTLYRVSGDSPIIKGLKRAAEQGKQVTVLVELKARFDEERNVYWAKELEKAGCHVIFGMNQLKTHSKITLVVRKKQGKIERFVHLGTGNYNDQTATLYTDMSLITSKRKFGIDATNFFNYLSGYTEKPVFHHISIAPYNMRDDFIQLIDDEISYHQHYGNGRIIAKMNGLTDKPIIKKLFEASQVGVQIDLIVRGICCLKPGIDEISDHITVKSIVGRFLEHSRVYYFHHNGNEKVFLSSADLMTRNMAERVEILFPIFEKRIKNRIKDILYLMLADNVKARQLMNDQSYYKLSPGQDEQPRNSQMILANDMLT